jgi:hypothetical protein
MSAAEPTPFAWEPLTPLGVAAFARATLSRLLVVQLLVALLAAGVITWFLYDSVFPVVRTAIQQLPDTGKIRAGQLNWTNTTPQLLAAGRFLALDVDANHSGQINPTADVQIEFGRDTVRLYSLLGYLEWDYPPDDLISFNRTELEPLWGAWKAEVLFIAAFASVIVLLLSWWLLATLYFLPVWLLGYYTNRDLTLRQSWRLAGAALLPGALLLALGIFLYDMGGLNLVQFGTVFFAHFVLVWIYLFVSLLFLPRTPVAPPKGNPFAPSK